LAPRLFADKASGGVVGRLAGSFLALRIGNFNVIIPVIFFAAASVLAMLVVALKPAGIIVISLLYGAMNAGCGCFVQYSFLLVELTALL
jgi:hypothetical protein